MSMTRSSGIMTALFVAHFVAACSGNGPGTVGVDSVAPNAAAAVDDPMGPTCCTRFTWGVQKGKCQGQAGGVTSCVDGPTGKNFPTGTDWAPMCSENVSDDECPTETIDSCSLGNGSFAAPGTACGLFLQENENTACSSASGVGTSVLNGIPKCQQWTGG
jgi:hypothetical protein